ncbi:TRAP transporter small permease [Chloroflexota bacterium]
MLSKIEKINARMNSALAAACGVVVLMVTFLTFADVLGRYLLGKPIIGTIEIIMLLLPWIASLSFAYGLIRGIQPRVTLFTSRLPNRFQPGLAIYRNLVGFAFFTLLTVGAWLHFWSSWEVKEIMFAALMTLPMWLSKLALPIGMFLIGASYFIFFMRAIGKKEQP